MVHRKIYVGLLCLLAAAMATSVFFANLFWFLLFVNWVAEWNWHEKFADFRSNRLLHAFIVLFAVHILWFLPGGNWHTGLGVLQNILPLMAIPLVVLTTRRLNSRERHIVMLFYILTIFVVSIIGFVRWITQPNLPYRNLVPFVSHIRFALNVCVVICLLADAVATCFYRRNRHKGLVLLCASLLVACLLFFLFLIRSYTAIAILSCVAFAAAVRCFMYLRRWQERLVLTLSFLLVSGVIILYVSHFVSEYYQPTALESQPQVAKTSQGNPYSHANDGLIENGGQLNNYICESELRETWPTVGHLHIDSLTPNGYAVYPTLVRYLGSLGLPKDASGVAALQPTDVVAIEQGIANHTYVNGSTIRKMIYVLLFEYECYRVNHTLVNSSVGERVLLWQNGWQVFCQHPVLGVGTCNAHDVCKTHLSLIQSPLAGTTKRIHNQYLTWLVMFGIVGFLLIVVAFLRAAWMRWQSWNFLLVAYLLIVLISFLTEDTLATLAGILLCTVPIAFLRQANEP